MFALKQQILIATDLLLKVFFAIGAILTTVALLWAAPFLYLSDASLESTGVKQSLISIDQQIESVNPSNVIDGIRDFFSGEEQLAEEDSASPGYFESTVYVNLVNTVSNVLRVVIASVSLILMGIIVYLSYATYGASKVSKLEHRVRELESKLGK